MLKQLVHGCTVTWATMAAAVLAGTPVAAQSIDALPAELKALYTDSIPVGPSAYDDFKMPAKPWKWCHSESYMGNPWRVSMTNELKRLVEGAVAKGEAVSFELSDSNGDVPQQIAQMRAFIDKGCSIITTIAGSSTGLNDVIEAAYKAGIPVVTTASAVTSPLRNECIPTRRPEIPAAFASPSITHFRGRGVRMHERDGGHAMTLEDWQNAARFLRSPVSAL